VGTAGAMGVTIVTPTNEKVYTHSTALPLDITLTSDEYDGTITCHYSIDFGVTNSTATSCMDMGIDIPITNSTDETQNKPIHLQYWAENNTAIIEATSNFYIYTNITTPKALVLIGVILLVFLIGVVFMTYAFKLGEDLAGLKLVFMLFSFIINIVSIHFGNLAIREYIRFTPLMEAYDRLYFSVIIFVVLLFGYLLVTLLIKAIRMIKVKGAGRI
jgi:hypothetical protein